MSTRQETDTSLTMSNTTLYLATVTTALVFLAKRAAENNARIKITISALYRSVKRYFLLVDLE